MKMFVKKSFLRAVEGAETGGSVAPAAPATDAGQEQAPAAPNEAQQPDQENEDPKARGSKDAVLADLARERDRRQAAEAKNKEFEARLKEIERSKMTEAERIEAERQEERQKMLDKIADYDKRFAQMEREKTIAEAVAKYKLPAAMADRIQGETPEEMLADAAKLAAALGPYTGPADSSAGKGAVAPKPTDLGGAIAAHYTK
ncbi:hypothetical protein QVA66_03910 [Staphylococcus chromogenes]|nr:hypothetical protein [Staphylococcus chromogenes]